MEVRPFGIGVSMIEPGDFATSFTANQPHDKGEYSASPYYESAVRAIATMARDEASQIRNLSPVIEAVETILECRRPALRYPRAERDPANLQTRCVLPASGYRRIPDSHYYGLK